MAKNFPIALSTIRPFLPDDVPTLADTLGNLPYTEERGYGFRALQQNGTYLTATLIKRRVNTIHQLDPDTRELISEEIFVFDEISFALDGRYRLLEVFGPLSHAASVRATLRGLMLSGTKLSPANIVPARLLGQLLEAGAQLDIQSMSVANFQHRDGIRGKYDIHTIPMDVAQQIIEQYPRNVKRAVVTVTLPSFDHFTLHILTRGGIRLDCAASQREALVAYLKSIYFKPLMS